METFIRTIETLSQKDVGEAVDALLSCFVNSKSEKRSELLMIRGQWLDNNQRFRSGLMPGKEARQAQYQVKHNFFEALRTLYPEDFDQAKIQHFLKNYKKEESSASVDFSKYSQEDIKSLLRQYKHFHRDSPDDVDILSQIGLCYLELGLFDLAKTTFQRCIEQEPDQHLNYYYYALSVIAGRRLSRLSHAETREVQHYVAAAMRLKEESFFHFLLANLKDDYYRYNGLGITGLSIAEHKASGSTFPPNAIENKRLIRQIPKWMSELLIMMKT